MYAVYDKVAEVYDTPIFFLTEVHAKRWFMDIVMKGEGRMENHSGDFELHKLIEFNVNNGKMYNRNGDKIIYESITKVILEGKNIGKEMKDYEKRNAT